MKEFLVDLQAVSSCVVMVLLPILLILGVSLFAYSQSYQNPAPPTPICYEEFGVWRVSGGVVRMLPEEYAVECAGVEK